MQFNSNSSFKKRVENKAIIYKSDNGDDLYKDAVKKKHSNQIKSYDFVNFTFPCLPLSFNTLRVYNFTIYEYDIKQIYTSHILYMQYDFDNGMGSIHIRHNFGGQ